MNVETLWRYMIVAYFKELWMCGLEEYHQVSNSWNRFLLEELIVA
jgi:hypothetical protein